MAESPISNPNQTCEDLSNLVFSGTGMFRIDYKRAIKVGRFIYLSILGTVVTTMSDAKSAPLAAVDGYKVGTIVQAFVWLSTTTRLWNLVKKQQSYYLAQDVASNLPNNTTIDMYVIFEIE